MDLIEISDVIEALDAEFGTATTVKAITPGGRVGDPSSLDRSPKKNWVEKRGGLPRYVRMVANALVRQGKSRSQAIQMAIGVIRGWCVGKGNVRPQVRAAACAAIAQWNAMKGSKSMDIAPGSFTEDNADAMMEQLADDGLITTETEESKGETMEIEHKSVSGMVTSIDEDEGIVETLVSVTGIVDGVKDIIEPGAYEKSLQMRTPKGVWSHSWETPVARTLDIKELMPGDPDLPETLPTGEKWPEEAGALAVKTEFNLETQRGKEAFSDVKFFGDDQEWSIGYQVPMGGAKAEKKGGDTIRHIHTLNLYEYSPVLFGAMPAARTTSVKDAKVEERRMVVMTDDEFMEFKSMLGDEAIVEGTEDEITDEVKEFDASDDEGVEPEASEEKKASTATQTSTASRRAPADDLGSDDDDEADVQDEFDPEDDEGADPEGESDPEEDEEETEGRTRLMDVVSDVHDDLGDYADRITELADEFDLALNEEDQEGMADAMEEILDLIDDNGDVEPVIDDAFQRVADGLAQIGQSIEQEIEDEGTTEPGEAASEPAAPEGTAPAPKEGAEGAPDGNEPVETTDPAEKSDEGEKETMSLEEYVEFKKMLTT